MTVSKTIDLELTRAEVEVLELEARLRVVPMNDTQLSEALKTALAAKKERLAKLRTLHATAGRASRGKDGDAEKVNPLHAGRRPPADVLSEEVILIGIGVVFAAVALAVKASPFGNRLAAQLPIMVVATLLTTLVLGVAGRWLGNELPPLAAVSFATVFLHFEVGFHSRHFGYVLAVAIVGLASLWIYAVTQLMVSLDTVVIWTLLLAGAVPTPLLPRPAGARDPPPPGARPRAPPPPPAAIRGGPMRPPSTP